MEISKEELNEIDDELETEHKRKIEAALFLAGKFMSIQELVALTDVNPLLLKKILKDLQDNYINLGIRIIQQNNLWKMDVAPEYISLINKLATGNSEFSKAEQETLAIIAYKQPMKQSVLVKIRGNKAYEHIKKFVELNLINKKKMGHTAELTLAEQFHDYFSLEGNEQLGESIEENAELEGNEIENEKKKESIKEVYINKEK